ncbi:MAG TPA: uroporphyrinogen-III C-methyltransferase [Rubrivivax sp.]|nr:uroporphyrinogen-III C-methyltransferase [Rubrivivax sp.]
MNEPLAPPDAGATAAEAPNAPGAGSTPDAPIAPHAQHAPHAPLTPHPLPARWIAAGAVLLAALCAAAVMSAWNTQQRVKGLEQQLVKRQEDSGAQAAEAQMLARQAQDSSRDAAAKVALLEARLAEVALQRTQLEELIQALSRSRDENLLAEVEATIRVAMQYAAITGSSEPMSIALKQAEERLSRQEQPRLDGVRRALEQDLERMRGAGAVDVSALAMRLDEVARAVDELPLLSAPQAQAKAVRSRASAAPAPPAAASAASAADSAPIDAAWTEVLGERGATLGARIWSEVRGLVRITPIAQPEAMLISPEQAQYLRENLKLRLLNARLALLGRQFDTAQADLRAVQSMLERYFDPDARRTAHAIDAVKQVGAQARHVAPPRPDATLAAIAAVNGTR